MHLPGYKASLDQFKEPGGENIAIVTTNDRFMNNAWAKDAGILEAQEDDYILMLSDGDDELARTLGLAEDMGRFQRL
jgi:alkyl hydroperoxide reductase 1